jgi:uncharacterized protein with HEPN domain
MQPNVKTWLYDMLQAIEEIDSFFAEGEQKFEVYTHDVRTKRAIERELEIIGEAANRILKAEPDFRLDNIKQIIGTRNRIVHGYDSVSDDMIWSIVINHLPKLRLELEALLAE